MRVKGKYNPNSNIFHEIKVIKGKNKVEQEPFEIIEDLTEIHEIKDIKNNRPNNRKNNQYNSNNYQKKQLYQNYSNERDIYNYQNNNNYITEDFQHQNQDINEYENQYIDNNNEINYEQEQVKYDNIICNDKICEENNEDDNEDLIETIFQQLKSPNFDSNNLKNTFKSLNEVDKNEIIEGLKIKVENEEQENRLNNLLKIIL